MKGVVFTAFLDLVEASFGEDVVDDILDKTELASGGSYSAVATYDHRELVRLVQALSQRVETPVPDLVRALGRYIFGLFRDGYANFFAGHDDAFAFLGSVEETIHVEVRKLYPDAELPRFKTATNADGSFTMIYESPRGFGDLAVGLIEACGEHFGTPFDVERTDLAADGTRIEFRITRLVPATHD